MDPQNQVQPQQNFIQPEKSSTHPIFKSLFVVIVALAILGAYWFFTTTDGKILLNKYFPTPKRTLSIIKLKTRALDSFSAQGTITIGTSTPNTFDGFANNGSSDYNLSFENKSSFDFGTMKAHVVANGSQIFGEDSFDGTWHALANGIESKIPTKETLITPKDAINSMCDANPEDSQISITDAKITVTCKNISAIDPYKSITSLTITADRSSYEITDVSLVGTNVKSKDVNLTVKFGNFNAETRTVTRVSNINPLGDFFARETLVINKNQGKSFDYFWNMWEKTNFNCTRCINPMADPDKDGLLNALEFLFNTNPNKATSGSQSKSDMDSLKSNVHPVTGKNLSASYASSIGVYLKHFGLMSIKASAQDKGFDPYSERQTTAQIPVVFKSNAKVITLVYESNLPPGNYVTVFVGDTLAQVIDLGKKETDWVNVNAAPFAGTTKDVTVVLNPYSKDTYDFKQEGKFDVKFPNLHINPLDRAHPFYVDATSASLKELTTVDAPKEDTRWKIGTNRVLEWYGPADTIYSLTILDAAGNPLGNIATTEGAEAGDKQHGYAWVIGQYITFVGAQQKTLPPGTYKIVARYVVNGSQEGSIPVATPTIY